MKIDTGTTSSTVISLTPTSDGWTHAWADLSSWAGQPITFTADWHQLAGKPYSAIALDEVFLGSWLTPDPQAITPEQIKVATTPVITITGDNFIAPVQVRLNNTPLPDATWINTNTITATVPVLPFGRYDVIVTNPGGQASGLAGALLVGYEVYLPLIHK